MSDGNNLIFISIASYRDAQLVPTINDLLLKAAEPSRLRFGICWQHGSDELPPPFQDDAHFQILDVDWRDSKGACWARAAIMELYRGEQWYLQLDSHCRFVYGWDEKLIATMQETGSAKPIVSTYPPPFTPATAAGEREDLGGDPLQMTFQGFTPEGIPFMKPLSIPEWQHRTAPLRARFLAAGFLFAPGSFVAEVPYDPELYFIGEEATMTLRAFTSGYDLFHPSTLLVWHDYVRAYATRHWDDHTKSNQVEREWSELDLKSKAKVRQLLAGEPVASHGLGVVRTLAEYEAFAGISFSQRKGQNYTLRSGEPPNPETAPDWADEIFSWMVRVVVTVAELPEGALEDIAFWYVGIHDEDRHEIFRRDFTRAELGGLTGEETKISLLCEFESGIIPASWSLWPVSRSRGWLQRIRGEIGEDDFSIVLPEQD